MKTVRDYMEIAKQFTRVWDDMKIRELISKYHGVDLSMLKFVEIRRIKKAMADFCCGDCAFSHEAKVWTMCDKHHCRAKGLCNDFQLNKEAQEYIERMNKHIAQIQDAKSYDEFLPLAMYSGYGFNFYDTRHLIDFYDCYIDESLAREALLSLAKYELKELEHGNEMCFESIAKLQQELVDAQNRLQERREQIRRTNDLIASLI